jgi:hypothetical protein
VESSVWYWVIGSWGLDLSIDSDIMVSKKHAHDLHKNFRIYHDDGSGVALYAYVEDNSNV